MRFILLFLMLSSSITLAATDESLAVVVRKAAVYSQADLTSAKVSELPAGTEVNVFGRQGGWKEIYSEKMQVIGWVRSYQVREGVSKSIRESSNSSDSRGFLSGLASLSRKASGFFGLGSEETATSSSTATIGVRGLSEQEIKSAQADFKQLKKMKTFASTPKRQTAFARKGKLRSNKVAYLK